VPFRLPFSRAAIAAHNDHQPSRRRHPSSGLMRALISFFGGALLLLGIAEMASAQSIRGQLLDDATAQPIAAATVALLGERADRPVQSVLTDAQGYFRIDIERAGRYRLRAQRLGYHTVTTAALEVPANDSIAVELRLSTEAVVLLPLTVTAKARPWYETAHPPGLWAFYERKEQMERLGLGRFIERATLDEWAGAPVAVVLNATAAVRIRPQGGRGSGYDLFTRSGCSPQLFLDGMPLRLMRGESIEDYVNTGTLDAIEVYHGAAGLPGQFAGSRSQCGAIAFWSRRS
jgi:hypothetical protein